MITKPTHITIQGVDLIAMPDDDNIKLPDIACNYCHYKDVDCNFTTDVIDCVFEQCYFIKPPQQ